MPGITVIPLGAVPEGLPESIARFLSTVTGQPGRPDSTILDPAFAYDRSRGQVDCRKLLPALEARAEALDTLVLGIADLDLFSAVFTFVFGEARLGGRAGLFSIHRLRPELYGLTPDPELLLARARREALHETGHLLGLVHCRMPECVMRFSGSAEEVDLKADRFCPACDEHSELRAARASRDHPGPGRPPAPIPDGP